MKKLLLPLMASLLLFAACVPDEPEKENRVVYQNVVYQGSFVERWYTTVEGNQWERAIEMDDATQTYSIPYLYYDYNNQWVNDYVLDSTFVLVYSIQGETGDKRDVPMPTRLTYTDTANVPHQVEMSYNVYSGGVRFVLTQLDGNNIQLQDFLKEDNTEPLDFKVCVLYN